MVLKSLSHFLFSTCAVWEQLWENTYDKATLRVRLVAECVCVNTQLTSASVGNYLQVKGRMAPQVVYLMNEPVKILTALLP